MERRFEFIKINNLKDMIISSASNYPERIAYEIKDENGLKNIKYKEVLDTVNALGTAFINMGLKDKRIAVIGENRYEWEITYLTTVCGTGAIVPFDKALPQNEIESLVMRSDVEAIVFSGKYTQMVKEIKNKGIGKLKYLISMDLDRKQNDIYSLNELIKEGKKLLDNNDKSFINSKVDSEKMNIMLFTSGTTAKSKVVELCHRNICTDLMDLKSVLVLNKDDVFLSVLPLHHVFECTIGFLLPLYLGAKITFCTGLRHISENLAEYGATVISCVPALYEQIYKNLMRGFQKAGIYDELQENMKKCSSYPIAKKREIFDKVHTLFGPKLKYMLCGAASIDKTVEEGFRNLGYGLIKGYGLTETSPVVTVETEIDYKIGSIGRVLPSQEVKLVDVDKDGMGELVVKGPNVMLKYYENEKETNKVLKNGWFYTGDLATIDDEGYVFICGRRKNVIVLKNGKNIFPEEMENLVNRVMGIKESFIYGKQNSEDVNDIKINAKIVYDKEIMSELYSAENTNDIYQVLNEKVKEINKEMPAYKAIRGITITETPLIKTTTSKIKRQEEIKLL